MSYTQVFGGTTIYPSDVSLLAITLNADKALEWPLESNDPSNPAARIIDVTTTGSYAITLPDATQTGAGQTILFNNLPASSNSFLLKDAGGSTIATVGVGEQWQVYLSGTATVAGTWRVFRYGASTATVQASALAGYGLTVTSNTLSQSLPVTTFNSGPRAVLLEDRASTFVWNGTGAGVLNLPTAASAGNNFFIGVRNSGGGDLTVDASGSELVDDLPSLALRPGDSANLLTDGLQWYTLGLGQEAVFAFDYTSISVNGGTYTLAGSELNRIVYKFVGTLTSDQYIVVPSTVQQYWVDNATTGAFSFFLRTSGGTPIGVARGTRGIYYCDGSNMVDADTSTISLPVSATDGGTGITSYTTGDLLYANSTTTLARLSDVAVGNALISGGVGVVPSWGKIGLTTHVSGTLPVANGGTGVTTSTGTGAVVLSTSPTLVTPNIGAATGTTLGLTTSIAIGAGANNTNFVDIGAGRTGNGLAYVDLIGDTTYTSYGLRLERGPVGPDSPSNLLHRGLGELNITAEDAGAISLRTNNLRRVYIDSAGNVGFGTALPTERVSVSGNISVTGGLTLGTALPVASGGTGATTLTGVVIGNGTSAFTAKTNPSGAFVGTTDAQTITNKTFTTGNTLDAGTSVSDTGTVGDRSPGFRGSPLNQQTGTAYTLVLSDAGKLLKMTNTSSVTLTVPPNSSVAFPIGTTITILNDNPVSSSIVRGAGVDLQIAGTGTTGNRTLSFAALVTLVKTDTNYWFVYGAGLS